MFVKELHCSLMKHNPDARLIVVGVKGEMETSIIQNVQALSQTEWREEEDLLIENFKCGSSSSK